MKLYEPEAINCFVFPVVPINAKEGAASEYKAVPGPDIETAFQRNLGNKYRMAGPYCCGRYDEMGRYCVYSAPVEGIRPGKFDLHPLAEEEFKSANRC